MVEDEVAVEAERRRGKGSYYMFVVIISYLESGAGGGGGMELGSARRRRRRRRRRKVGEKARQRHLAASGVNLRILTGPRSGGIREREERFHMLCQLWSFAKKLKNVMYITRK